MVVWLPSSRRMQFLLFALTLLSILMGCASSPTHNQETAELSPLVYVAISKSADGFAETAQRVIPNKLWGMNVTFDPEAMTGTDLRLDLRMTYRNVTEREFETIWRITTGILLTLYPSTCRHRAYMLTATLNDAHGNSRTYEETDSTIAWLWLLHGPKCGDTPTAEEIESATERMLDAAFDRMRKDDAFAGIGLAARDTPLVNIVINRAADIANQVLSVDRPFARWTIGDNATPVPDYRIDLHFDVKPGSFSISRAYLGIMTLGLTSPCRRSTITLTATVTGPGAVMTKSYTFTDSLSGRMGAQSDCEIPDETTRPEIFAKLLRRVFRQIDQDKLIEIGSHHAGTSLPPLVRVSVSRAESIVRRETLRAEPFARYYFHDSGDYTPDYTLTLEFRFEGGGRKEFSTPGAIGAGMAIAFGVNMFCNPTAMILDGGLTNRNGREVRRFHIERKFDFSGELTAISCHDDEITNPEAVSELVRSLYKEMEADGTLANISAWRNLSQ